MGNKKKNNNESPIIFHLEGKEFIPLCDLLKRVNLCQTGGHAKVVIAEGEVSVDGQVELRKKNKIRVGQEVLFDGHLIKVLS